MQTGGPSSVKIELADGVNFKKETSAKQEVKFESQDEEKMKIDHLWLQVKGEIKEEIEQEEQEKRACKSSSLNDLTSEEIMMPAAKRRRLTCRDMQQTMQTGGPSSAIESADGVKVKKEKSAEQEVSFERQDKEKMEPNDLWLRVHKEVKLTFAAANSAAGHARTPPEGESGASQVQTSTQHQLGPSADEDSANPEESSLDAFASHAATWATQCLAFRSSKTWSPTRPCCPANVFLGPANGTPSPPPPDAPPCVLRLTGHGLRCLQRFHEKHRLQNLTFQSQAEASQTPRDMSPQEPRADSDLSMQDYKVRSMDSTKTWPWMRGLTTSIWAGGGWALDENGLRRLSSSGGSHAMQGVEVFESVGLAAEEVKASDEKIAEEPPIAVAAAENGLPPSGEQKKPYQFKRNNIAKQSGIPNVKWDRTLMAWQVKFPKLDSKGKKISSTNRVFSVKKFIGPGISEAQADAAALEAAKAFRAELVEKGILLEPKLRDLDFTSEVPGVKWDKQCKKWEVSISGTNGGKRIHGGYFTEKAAAETKALELVEKVGLQREVKPVAALSELPVFHPKVPYPRVNWSQTEQQWRAKSTVGGATRDFRVKPKDHSEAELERSFQVAVAWRKKQEKNQMEKEKEKALKSKAKPGKNRRK